MRQVFTVFAQFLLFLFFDAMGSIFYHPFRLQTSLSGTPLAPRSFVWDGLIFMLVVYVILLAIAALRKRLGTSARDSTLALGLAALAGYFLKFGFITHNW